MNLRGHALGVALVAWAVALVAIMAGCSAQLGDRGGQNGAPPDKIEDVSWIVVFRNADDYPNIAQTCAGGLAFATTSTGRGESGGATPLIRVPEWDSVCMAHGQRAPR